jgi:hypothetical protein
MPIQVEHIKLGGYANDGTGDDLRTAFTKVNSNFNLLFNEANVTNGVNLGSGVPLLFDKNPATLALEFKTLTSLDTSVVFTSDNQTVDLKAKTIVQNDLIPKLGGNLNLDIFNVYGGDIQTTVYGLDVPITNSVVSTLLASNSLNLDMGAIDAPTGYQRYPNRGYSIDLNGTGASSGFIKPLVNDYDFGTFATQNRVQIGGSFLTLGGNLVTSGGNITLTTSGTSNVVVPSAGTLATTSNRLDQFAPTTSAQLASIVGDETGSGLLVFNTNPSISSPTITGAITFSDGSTLSSAAGLAGSNAITNGSFTATLDSSGILNLPGSLKFSDGSVLSSFTSIIPNQGGNGGKFLTTSGSAVSWATVPTPTTISGLTLTGGATVSSGSLTFSGNISAPAWTTNGIRHVSVPSTFTDTSTATNGTVALAYTNTIGGNIIAASNTGVVYTTYGTMFVNVPTAGSNVTITNPYSIITAGNVLIGSTGTSTITAVASTATASSTAASLGYLGMPVNSQSGSTYAVVVGDLGKVIYFSATCTATIPASLPIGSSIAFVAGTGATITIAQASDSMYLGGTGTTGSRTLAAYGMATAIKMAATVWFINGTGLT